MEHVLLDINFLFWFFAIFVENILRSMNIVASVGAEHTWVLMWFAFSC
jgi:hypothetical protein